jgi:hypothetical protein
VTRARTGGRRPSRRRNAPGRAIVALRVPRREEFLGLVRDVTGCVAALEGFAGPQADRLAAAVEAAAGGRRGDRHGGARTGEGLRLARRGGGLRAEVTRDGAGWTVVRLVNDGGRSA